MRNFPSINYSLNYKNYYSLVKTIVEMQWGKVIDTHGAIFDNDLRLDLNIMSKAIIQERTGSKRVTLEFKNSNYILTTDMRKFRENFNKEFD
jgi:vacuolar-type H+-ATPase catalytic subunit A/Vma1